jgi:hypothetical protein
MVRLDRARIHWRTDVVSTASGDERKTLLEALFRTDKEAR